MQRIAVPMIGGMVSSTVLTLVVITAVYCLAQGWGLPPASEPLASVAQAERHAYRPASRLDLRVIATGSRTLGPDEAS